jgi:stage V sporulation protein SpoVS
MSMSIREYPVASTTKSDALAGAIAHAVREGDGIDLTAYGPRQMGLAAAGAALAREFLLDDGIGLTVEVLRIRIMLTPDCMGYGIKITLRPHELYAEDAPAQIDNVA